MLRDVRAESAQRNLHLAAALSSQRFTIFDVVVGVVAFTEVCMVINFAQMEVGSPHRL